mgnify:CR=1 FL=1
MVVLLAKLVGFVPGRLNVFKLVNLGCPRCFVGLSGFRRVVLLTLAITPSGALSPGPLSASAVALGALLGPLAGFVVALGHMVVELPYVILLYRFSSLLRGALGVLRVPFNLFVVAFLLYFSYLLLRDSMSLLSGSTSSPGASLIFGEGLLGALATGVLLTGLNVYFLLWWLTVGYPLVEESSKLGFKGLTVMYASHVWMDYAWLTLLAGGGGATRLLGSTPYAVLLAILAVILVVFAAKISIDTINNIRRL